MTRLQVTGDGAPRQGRLRARPLAPQRQGGLHFGLRVNAQCVGDAVNVIEIGNYFDGVKDIAVSEVMFAQCREVLRPQGGGGAREEFGKFAQRALTRRKLGATVVVFHVLGMFSVFCLVTEILPVRFDSIETVIGP